MTDRKLMIVKWQDHFSRSGWHNTEPADLEPLQVETVGWLVGEDDVMIALATSVSSSDRSDFSVSILKVAIIDTWEVVF